MAAIRRSFVSGVRQRVGQEVCLRGWIFRLRVLARTTFIILKDCTGTIQCVGATPDLHTQHLKLDDAIEIMEIHALGGM